VINQSAFSSAHPLPHPKRTSPARRLLIHIDRALLTRALFALSPIDIYSVFEIKLSPALGIVARFEQLGVFGIKRTVGVIIGFLEFEVYAGVLAYFPAGVAAGMADADGIAYFGCYDEALRDRWITCGSDGSVGGLLLRMEQVGLYMWERWE
jgi:hypothetical protein